MLLASKLLWALFQPLPLALMLLVAGLALSFTRRIVIARISLLGATAIIVVCGFTSFGYVAVGALEARFQPPTTHPTKVAAIIVLGGGMNTDINAVRGGYELGQSGDRFVEALRLARLYPAAKVVISGGAGVLAADDTVDTEAEAGARFFEAFDVPRERLVLEDASRTTAENVGFTRELLGDGSDGALLLVTSAFHMPRSVGLFRKAGIDIIPWPADYLASGAESFGLAPLRPAENLAISTIAIREWAALASYWITGRIDEFVPAQ